MKARITRASIWDDYIIIDLNSLEDLRTLGRKEGSLIVDFSSPEMIERDGLDIRITIYDDYIE